MSQTFPHANSSRETNPQAKKLERSLKLLAIALETIEHCKTCTNELNSLKKIEGL